MKSSNPSASFYVCAFVFYSYFGFWLEHAGQVVVHVSEGYISSPVTVAVINLNKKTRNKTFAYRDTKTHNNTLPYMCLMLCRLFMN